MYRSKLQNARLILAITSLFTVIKCGIFDKQSIFSKCETTRLVSSTILKCTCQYAQGRSPRLVLPASAEFAYALPVSEPMTFASCLPWRWQLNRTLRAEKCTSTITARCAVVPYSNVSSVPQPNFNEERYSLPCVPTRIL